MTREELERIANAPGFGSGKAARDRMAAEAECAALLPQPQDMPAVWAAPDAPYLLMCSFGSSGDDGNDWALYHADRDALVFGQDAKDDAQIVAAILNAYRLGVLVRK